MLPRDLIFLLFIVELIHSEHITNSNVPMKHELHIKTLLNLSRSVNQEDLNSIERTRIKLCKCKNGGTCIETKEGEKCKCAYPYGGSNCEDSHWCSEGFGSRACPIGKCRFNFKSLIGHCECSENEYYDYKNKKCETINQCSLMFGKCNSVTEDCINGKCVCKKNFKPNDKKECIPNFCDSKPYSCDKNEKCEEVFNNPGKVKCSCKTDYVFDGKECKKGTICDLLGSLGCEHDCNIAKGICECKSGFALQSDKKSCKLIDETNKCTKNCGVGVCVKSKVGDVCICPRTHLSRGSTCVDLCTLKSLPSGICPKDECLADQKLGFKCKCDGKLTHDENKISCRKKDMCEEGGGKQACDKINAKCINNFDLPSGYNCECKNGQEFVTDGSCKNKCELDKYKEPCYQLLAICEIVNEKPTCKCQPMLTFGEDGRCTEIAKYSFTGILPIAIKYYLPISSILQPKIIENYPDLKRDIKDSMQLLHGDNYKHADVVSCKFNLQNLECVVEVQFNSDPRDQVQIMDDPKICLGNDKDVCLVPPNLLLKRSQIKEKLFSPTYPCQKSIKNAICGNKTNCFNVNDSSLNFECRCKEGFVTYGSFQPLSDKRTIIHRCEDINECLNPGACPNTTRCVNTFGSYECVCQTGFRQINTTNVKHTGCIAMCVPKECKYGKCEHVNGVLSCKCAKGYSGINCDEEIDDLEGPHGVKISIIVLSTLFIPMVILTVYLTCKYRSLQKKPFRSSYDQEYSNAINLRYMK